MNTAGYYRYPTIRGETIVFQCEDDLWSVPLNGGVARRLTTSLSEATRPSLSPDGQWLAFSGREEGPLEVYCMPAEGGEPRRLTYHGSGALVIGWHEGKILYASGAGEAFGVAWIWAVSPEGGSPERLPYGPAHHIAFGPNGGVVLGRHTVRDPARWKRYRGGTAGRLWIDPDGSGEFHPLEPVPAQYTGPMWIGDRIYFIADPEGIANLYSCLPTGDDLRRHTHHEEFYCRSPQTDGQHIVYHAGGDLFAYHLETDVTEQIPITFRSPRTQRQRKFVETGTYLHEFAPHPDGHAIAFTSRGKLFAMANWEGAVLQYGHLDGVRYRLPDWLNDGNRLVVVSDADGEEALEIHFRDKSQEPIRLAKLDIGRPTGLVVSPKQNLVALTNHRFELVLVDLDAQTIRLLDKSPYHHILGVSWSPDGRWLAYGFASTERTCSLKVVHVVTGETHLVTAPEFFDYAPEWDPEGKYLYFLSNREFNPVYDSLHFDLGFPQATRLLLVTLKKETPSPFVPEPRPLDSPPPKDESKSNSSEEPKTEKKEITVEIDFDGISGRVVGFPYPEGRYSHLVGIEGKALFVAYPVRPSLPSPFAETDSEPQGVLHAYTFKEQKKEILVSGLDSFELSRDRKTLVYRAGKRLRVLKAGEKSDENLAKEAPSRRSGWIDLNRAKVSVVPSAEWRQMYREAWRLQRDYFWTEDMSGVDWELVYNRYLPLVDRIATRGEFSDLMWEMQGELGTSHCYEFGGDYRPSPNYAQGYLGADLVYDPERNAYRIVRIPRGDSWDEGEDSPLARPGVNVKEGDFIVAIGGIPVGRERSPMEALVHQANQEVAVTVLDGENGEKRVVTIKALASEATLRYRDWVAKNRRYVHEKTNGRVGYVHIPDMGPRGYAEFHRGYLKELDYPALLVDVRYNGGGHVSPLILEKLARRRIGYDRPRWGAPIPYPPDSVLGPMICLTNENAGSDGDIFCHGFKLMKLGKLVGKRTWGGVIGISPKSQFVDGGLTTQPEYSFWFYDVGWGVENYGTDPDIEVEYPPQDYVAERDPQLDRAIEEILQELEANPPQLPDFENRPRLTLPRLPR